MNPKSNDRQFLSGKRVVVTGGAGFVGSHLVKALVENSAEVFVLERPGSSLIRLDLNGTRENVNTLAVDLTDFNSTIEVIKSVKPDHVFHLAAAGVKVGSATDEDTIRINILSGASVSQACAIVRVKRLIWMGSGFEYSLNHEGVYDESVSLEPCTVYGAAKISAWEIASYYARITPFEMVTVRLFSTYGPSEHPTRLVPYVISRALTGQRIETTAGTQIRDYLYVEDVASALKFLASSPDSAGRVFNLGSGVPISVQDFIKAIAVGVGGSVDLKFGTREITRPEAMFLVADITRLNRLGWKPNFTIQDGIKMTVDWYREHLTQIAQLP